MLRRRERVVEAGDGTSLYARLTQGPRAQGTPLVCANGVGVSTIFWRYLEEDFAAEHPVVAWDYRGHGRSEFPRDLEGLTIEANADDMARVLDAFGIERAVCLGHSMGCQVVYTFAHRHPERAAALVPMLGAVGRPVHTFLDAELPSLLAFLFAHGVVRRFPEPIRRGQRRLLTSRVGRRLASRIARLSGLVHAERMPQEDLDAYLDHFGVLAPIVFFKMAEKMATHTAAPYLPEIEAPTLVVAGERDVFTPLYLSEEAVDRLPNARLFVLPEGSHAALVEQPEALHAELRRFLREAGLSAPDSAASQPRVA
ncbi:MAG: alpha/beta hydrolase [Planctomycetota bacterium]|nr:MAG: alpha/beta hydrolase [Planctomycetota bacterium]